MDHSTAYKVIDGVLHTLQTMRSEEKFGEIFGYASDKAESLDIPVPTVVPGQERKRKVPVRFQHIPTVSQVGVQFESVEAYFRSSVYFTFLDTKSVPLQLSCKRPQINICHTEGKQWAAHLSCLCENDTNLSV